MEDILKKLPMENAIEEEGVIEEWENEDTRLTSEVVRGGDGILEVNGTLVESILDKINPDEPDSVRHFHKLLKDMGIIKMLRDAGAQDADTVRLNGEDFDFVD
jgi:GTP-binding protein